MQHRHGTQSLPTTAASQQSGPPRAPPMGPGRYDATSEFLAVRDANMCCGDSSTNPGPEPAIQTPSTMVLRPRHRPSSAHTPSGGGTLREHHEPQREHQPVLPTNNSSKLLHPNSSKSSPPYTLSQRKQLRVEGQSYLKEMKRSIAEDRVPQVHLHQNNSVHVIQYKL